MSDHHGHHCRSGKHEESEIRLACVGDSITEGSGYVDMLQKLMGDRCKVGNFGRSGKTALRISELNGCDGPYWSADRFSETFVFCPHVIVFCLGTNDSKVQNWTMHKGEFKTDYCNMLHMFRVIRSKPQIWLCLPSPVFEPGAFGIQGPVIQNEIIPIIKDVAEEYGLPIIDLHTPLINNPDYFPDTVHPDPRGAQVIAETVFNALTGDLPDKNSPHGHHGCGCKHGGHHGDKHHSHD